MQKRLMFFTCFVCALFLIPAYSARAAAAHSPHQVVCP